MNLFEWEVKSLVEGRSVTVFCGLTDNDTKAVRHVARALLSLPDGAPCSARVMECWHRNDAGGTILRKGPVLACATLVGTAVVWTPAWPPEEP